MSLTENERRIAQAAICSAILDFCDAYVRAVTPGAKRHTIGLYAAVRAEVDVLDCVSSLRERGWIVAYPKVLNASGQMDMFVVDSPVRPYAWSVRDSRAQCARFCPGASGLRYPIGARAGVYTRRLAAWLWRWLL